MHPALSRGEQDHAQGGGPDDQGTFALGVNWWNPPFQGRLDELHVYKGALLAAQVADLAALKGRSAAFRLSGREAVYLPEGIGAE